MTRMLKLNGEPRTLDRKTEEIRRIQAGAAGSDRPWAGGRPQGTKRYSAGGRQAGHSLLVLLSSSATQDAQAAVCRRRFLTTGLSLHRLDEFHHSTAKLAVQFRGPIHTPP